MIKYVVESKKGRKIHGQAEEAREKEQDFLKALKLLDEATIAYQEDNDYLGLSEAQNSKSIVLKHLFEKTKDKSYLILARLAAQAAVEIAEKNNVKQALPLAYFNLGKAYEEEEKYKDAVTLFQKASENKNKLPQRHDRPAIKADIKTHLAFAQYMSGDKSAILKLEEGIVELENSDEYRYTKDVWLSGAHMRAAKALKNDDRKKAEKHLTKAKQIITANPQLKLRLGQWEKLAEEFK